ncbi:MAG: PAS domain S-box protein, partial [Bacteroidota bacterium]
YRFMRPDGSITWVIGQAISEKNDEGQVIGYIGTLTDITERMQAEEKIRQSESQFRMVWESSIDGMRLTD